MDSRRKYPLRGADMAGLVASAGPRLVYVSSGYPPRVSELLAPEEYVRVLMLAPADGFAALQAAHRGWCEQASLQLGFAARSLDVSALLEPAADSAWARVAVARRAELLTQAIELVAGHAEELAVLDLAELQAQAREPGVLRLDGVALEHLFFGMLAHRAERLGDAAVLALAAATDEQWQLRQVFSEPGLVWGRGLVLAPPGAVAGVAVVELAERVVALRLARRTGGVADPATSRERPLAPALEAALRAGWAVLAPRLSSLMSARAQTQLH